MTQLVQGYGLHRQDDLVWLHEGDGARCLTPGLEGLESPFTVIKLPRQRCPHVLPRPEEGPLPVDRLAEILSPKPNDRLYWAPPSHGPTVFAMSEYFSQHPSEPAVYSWTRYLTSIRALAPKLQLTNCIPMVVAGYIPRDFQDVVELSRLPRTRALVLVGYPKIPEAIDLSQVTLNSYEPDELRRMSAAYLHLWLMRIIRHEHQHENHLP